MVEDMMERLVSKLKGSTKVVYDVQTEDGGFEAKEIDFKKPWRRLSIYDGLRERLGIEPTTISDEQLRSVAHKLGIDALTRGDMMLSLFEEVWEKDLIQPTFVKDFPADTSALTKRHREDPELTERFVTYMGGFEMMNCYTELNDPRDQRKRFELELQKRAHGDTEAMQFDEDFIVAQEYGMPQQAGIGISIDRPTMILTNSKHIRNVIYFPTLKKKGL